MNRFYFLGKIKKALLIILLRWSLFRMEFNPPLLQYGTTWVSISIRTLILPLVQKPNYIPIKKCHKIATLFETASKGGQ